MIRAVETALLEVQAALLARALYPKGHPRIQACEGRAQRLLQDLLEQRPEISLFCVDRRVIFDNEVLPGSRPLVETLFSALRRSGVDRVTFRRGLEESEIRDLLDSLAALDDTERGRLMSSAHLRFGFIRDDEAVVLEDPVDPVVEVPLVGDATERLGDIWAGIGGEFDPAPLRGVVASLSDVIARTADAMLPLAPLKRHDEYTFVHTINVALLSAALAEALGLDARTVRDISFAALLHDVGKQAVPDRILNKNGRLDPEERRIMEHHPEEGARILFNTPGVPELVPIVAYEHHVRADGSGYPAVPSGWRLNLASRIVQVADVFDALRTHRPYRAGMPVPKIVGIMTGDVGTFFDGDLLEVFFDRVVSRGAPDPVPLEA